MKRKRDWNKKRARPLRFGPNPIPDDASALMNFARSFGLMDDVSVDDLKKAIKNLEATGEIRRENGQIQVLKAPPGFYLEP